MTGVAAGGCPGSNLRPGSLLRRAHRQGRPTACGGTGAEGTAEPADGGSPSLPMEQQENGNEGSPLQRPVLLHAGYARDVGKWANLRHVHRHRHWPCAGLTHQPPSHCTHSSDSRGKAYPELAADNALSGIGSVEIAIELVAGFRDGPHSPKSLATARDVATTFSCFTEHIASGFIRQSPRRRRWQVGLAHRGLSIISRSSNAVIGGGNSVQTPADHCLGLAKA